MTRPEADLLAIGNPVTVAGRDLRIERRDGTADKPIVRVEGVVTREEALELRGEPLWVDRGLAAPLEEDEWWADDLVGLAVVDGDREVGRVDRVVSLPSCEVLEVGELLIPLVSDAVRTVDIAAGRIDVDLEFLGES